MEMRLACNSQSIDTSPAFAFSSLHSQAMFLALSLSLSTEPGRCATQKPRAMLPPLRGMFLSLLSVHPSPAVSIQVLSCKQRRSPLALSNRKGNITGAFVMMRGWGAGPGQGVGAPGGPGHTVRTTRATCHPHHRDILTALGLNSTATAHRPHGYSLRLTSWAGPCLPQSS